MGFKFAYRDGGEGEPGEDEDDVEYDDEGQSNESGEGHCYLDSEEEPHEQMLVKKSLNGPSNGKQAYTPQAGYDLAAGKGDVRKTGGLIEQENKQPINC